MPKMCFSYPVDVPPGTRTRNAAQSAQSGWLNCISYPADVPRSMPFTCFSYSADVPQGGGNSDAAQSDVPGLRRMPNMCFRY